jgi:hypothetical protein
LQARPVRSGAFWYELFVIATTTGSRNGSDSTMAGCPGLHLRLQCPDLV